MVDINPDGKFIINEGQGITQGIKQELNLSDEQCLILQKNSVWVQIINEIDKEGNIIVSRNQNSTQNPAKSNNFLVYTGDIIEFSKTCWNKIIRLINKTLNTNIHEIEDVESAAKNNQQTDSEKEEVCDEAYNKILENINKLNLPANFDKTNIETKLFNVYQAHLKDLPERVELYDITRSMICELLDETGLSLEERYKLGTECANIIYSQNITESGLKLSKVSANSELQKKVEEARDILTNALKELDINDLKRIGLDESKRNAILSYLETLYYESGEYSNTMQSTTLNGKPVIAINEKLTGYDSIENIITMLVHEANHCYDTNFNTKQQERECETLGCLTTALLIEKGILSDADYGRYPQGCFGAEKPHKFTDYLTNRELLKNDIDTWAGGYTNYLDDASGSITLEHNDTDVPNKQIRIEAGDIVQIGERKLIIGTDCYLSGMNSMPIFQVSCHNGEPGATNIVFNGLEPTEKEIAGCGKETLHRTDNMQEVKILKKGSEEVICAGYVYAE